MEDSMNQKIKHAHGCPEWDYLLISPEMPEWKNCQCIVDPDCEDCQQNKE